MADITELHTDAFAQQYEYSNVSDGDIIVDGNGLYLSFLTSLDQGFPSTGYNNIVTAAVNKAGPGVGINTDGYQTSDDVSIPAITRPVNYITIVPTTRLTNQSESIHLTSSLTTGYSGTTQFNVDSTPVETSLRNDVVAVGPGVVIPEVEASLYVNNIAKVGQLQLDGLLPPPTTLVGSSLDRAGMIRVDDTTIYYCSADYDGSTEIWKTMDFPILGAGYTFKTGPVTNYPYGAVGDTERDVRITLDNYYSPVLFYCFQTYDPANSSTTIWGANAGLSSSHYSSWVKIKESFANYGANNTLSSYAKELNLYHTTTSTGTTTYVNNPIYYSRIIIIAGTSASTINLDINAVPQDVYGNRQDGWWFIVKNLSTQNTTIVPSAYQINGVASAVIPAGASAKIVFTTAYNGWITTV